MFFSQVLIHCTRGDNRSPAVAAAALAAFYGPGSWGWVGDVMTMGLAMGLPWGLPQKMEVSIAMEVPQELEGL